MARKGSTAAGMREIVGTELSWVAESMLGRQAMRGEVWSLAPTDFYGNPRKLGPAARVETVWVAASDGLMWWVAFDHTTGDVLEAHDTKHRAA